MIDSLKSKQFVGIKSELPESIVFSCINEDTKRRVVLCPETGLSQQRSRSNKICLYCGKPKGGRGSICRDCYQKIRAVRVIVKCSYCGKEVEKYLYDYRKALKRGHIDFYCNLDCSQKHHAVKNAKHCAWCDSPMPGRKTLKYCSKECRMAASTANRRHVICPECGKEFIALSHLTRYCSNDCADAAHSKRMVGTGNSNFKDGMSYSKLYDLMRPLILERDGGQCVVCGIEEDTYPDKQGVLRSTLAIHHIDKDTTKNNPENLITICKTCHAIHHKSHMTPWPWFAKYAQEKSRSMTSKWKETVISLQEKYSYTIVS